MGSNEIILHHPRSILHNLVHPLAVPERFVPEETHDCIHVWAGAQGMTWLRHSSFVYFRPSRSSIFPTIETVVIAKQARHTQNSERVRVSL